MEIILKEKKDSNKVIATWVFCGVGMIVIQVLIGGITRLTGSGLSITEWKPIMGFLPPLNETEWQKAFTQYKSIAQYKYVNNHFGLSDFKFIFFWEWFHRLWARVILTIAFAIPFIYFLKKRMIKKEMVSPLLTLVLLGALEGAVGWIMVKSGLNDENIYVNHIKLSIHFIIAMFIASYAMLFGLSLISKETQKVNNINLKKLTITIIILLTIQLLYGAFMAGLKAANAAPTWPTINGAYFPNIFPSGIVDGLFFNVTSIHFIHRTLAYIICLLIIFWRFKAKQNSASMLFSKFKNLPLVFVVTQVLLGILSILLSTKIVLGHFGIFEWLALAHQLTGMLLLLSLVSNVYLINGNKDKSVV